MVLKGLIESCSLHFYLLILSAQVLGEEMNLSPNKAQPESRSGKTKQNTRREIQALPPYENKTGYLHLDKIKIPFPLHAHRYQLNSLFLFALLTPNGLASRSLPLAALRL